MKILLSPSKSLNEDCQILNNYTTKPRLLNYSEQLVSILKKYSISDISKLMSISIPLSEINYERYQNWQTPFESGNSVPCGYFFSGDAYRGLDYDSLNKEEVEYSQQTLRILSGLYGVLRPLDLIRPYRLEMGTKIKIDNKTKNLYTFWGDKITDLINSEIKDKETIVNLASNEYFKSINLKKIKGRMIQCVFKEDRGGQLKTIMIYAKRARGLMSRYIIQNKIEKAEDLIGFDLEKYCYDAVNSTEDEYIFIR